jgi:hypothetical protein
MKNLRNRQHKNPTNVAPVGRLRFLLGVCKKLNEVNAE